MNGVRHGATAAAHKHGGDAGLKSCKLSGTVLLTLKSTSLKARKQWPTDMRTMQASNDRIVKARYCKLLVSRWSKGS